ncbi:hypothetical protein JOF48_000871 [Arthrobacter stackebrandtii]|uniref:Uncharacterized protein n=1 Tax=Arthrobacter stackebrandtii TaxID=272161 RepID=A0ABS4YTE4_9MICC|nr:hypothetical protein [Arthrobacter stackebrandtii]MBP2412068.1 hypothetical protein [Arthrobacter stackebrandtii]MBP2412072.1 hypothetical protein [Arthrobacter stackebrandtii]
MKQVPAGTGQSEISTAILLGVAGNVSSWIAVFWWVVFGTLLGPGTTTGPPPFLWGWVCGCAWFPAHDGLADLDTLVLLVGMCVVGLLFENYIVNASIFYKKAISLRK